MGASQYYKEKELYFSCIYGSGIYRWSGRLISDALNTEPEKQRTGPSVINVKTGEEFLVKRLAGTVSEMKVYQAKILNPPSAKVIVWPFDLIELSGDQQTQCNLFVEREYSAKNELEENRKGTWGLLFPCNGYPVMISAQRYLAQAGELSWKNPMMKKLVVELLKTMHSLNEHGYIYADIHLSRLFVAEGGSVHLDFSNLIEWAESTRETERWAFQPGNYPMEFAEPAIIQKEHSKLDLQTQNYSICALLFYLCFGRHAYDGRLLTGYADDNKQQRDIKFRDYHKMPVFIFDSKDAQNALGAFEEEERIIELWRQCPKELRELFEGTLKQSNAERRSSTENPTPKCWLDCVKHLGWMTEESGPEER